MRVQARAVLLGSLLTAQGRSALARTPSGPKSQIRYATKIDLPTNRRPTKPVKPARLNFGKRIPELGGRDMSDLAQGWMKHFGLLPRKQNPSFASAKVDLFHGQDPSSPVWYLPESWDDANGTRPASAKWKGTVPRGKWIFTPTLYMEVSTLEGNGKKTRELRESATNGQNDLLQLDATLDGEPLGGLYERFQSRFFGWGPLPKGNALEELGGAGPGGAVDTISPLGAPSLKPDLTPPGGIGPGLYSSGSKKPSSRSAVMDGNYLLLPPLSPGEHVLVIQATDESGTVSYRKYKLTYL